LRSARSLVTGASGQLGSELSALLAETGEVLAAGHDQLDITDDVAVTKTLNDFSPQLVINCAAFHNVDQCEDEEDRSFEVNVRAVKRLAQGCAARGAKLVHFSTNYVFDGERDEPYTEDDIPSPRSAYAISKLAGEHAALAYSAGALVIRSAGLYGLRGSESKGGNFVTRMVVRARKGAQLTVVADQRLTPTFTADLARAVVEAVGADVDGLLHVTNGGDCSWFEFTEAIMAVAGLDVPVAPGETPTGSGVTQRPRNGVLRSARARALGLTPLRHWREALLDYMQRAGLEASAAASGR
jgi:dTDP-4-dehydrorhamnose reductase